MKILVVSDTHGRLDNFNIAFQREQPDEIYHLGDGLGCEDLIAAKTNVPLTIVRGNCDWVSDLKIREIREVGNHRILLTHGHFYSANQGVDGMIEAADQLGADVILYGHTHVPELRRGYYGKTIMNPGSLTSPRQVGRKHTYGIITVSDDGELSMELRQIE